MQIKQNRRIQVSKLAAFTLAACAIEPAQATDGYLEHGYGVKSQGMGGVGIALASLAAGIAVYGNGGMNTRYRSGIPLFGRSEAGVDLEQLFVSPHIAWKIAEHHALGAAVNFAWQRFEAKGLANFDNPMFSNSPGYVTDRGGESSTGWGLRLGYTGQLTPDVAIGATWSSRIAASRFDEYRGLFADGGAFDIPQNYGIGAAWKIAPGLTVAADIRRLQPRRPAGAGL